MTDLCPIVAAGAGRMGQGIAITFALAGYPVRLLDMKQRDDDQYALFFESCKKSLSETLQMLCAIGLVPADKSAQVLARISHFSHAQLSQATKGARFIFEAVPETLDAKREALAVLAQQADSQATIASTTSTILSTQLQQWVAKSPQRFLNAHWLNPAYLVPLVELSPTDETDDVVTQGMKSLLESIGKVPVVCAPSPGYIVPRIQALAMNEAARLVEEGVASAEDIDKATRYGFGFRFAILGLLEFIDWGGGDILFQASRYLAQETGQTRFDCPASIEKNMAEGRTGLATGQGFLDYSQLDVAAYQQQRLAQFANLLHHLNIAPTIR